MKLTVSTEPGGPERVIPQSMLLKYVEFPRLLVVTVTLAFNARKNA